MLPRWAVAIVAVAVAAGATGYWAFAPDDRDREVRQPVAQPAAPAAPAEPVEDDSEASDGGQQPEAQRARETGPTELQPVETEQAGGPDRPEPSTGDGAVADPPSTTTAADVPPASAAPSATGDAPATGGDRAVSEPQVAALPEATGPDVPEPDVPEPRAPAASEGASQAGLRPSFDIVRIERSGETVIAGRGAPGSEVQILLNGKVLGSVVSDLQGQWVFLPQTPLDPGNHQLSLRSEADGGRLVESDNIVVVVVPEPQVARPAPDPVKREETPGAQTGTASQQTAESGAGPARGTTETASLGDRKSAPTATAPPSQPEPATQAEPPASREGPPEPEDSDVTEIATILPTEPATVTPLGAATETAARPPAGPAPGDETVAPDPSVERSAATAPGAPEDDAPEGPTTPPTPHAQPDSEAGQAREKASESAEAPPPSAAPTAAPTAPAATPPTPAPREPQTAEAAESAVPGKENVAAIPAPRLEGGPETTEEPAARDETTEVATAEPDRPAGGEAGDGAEPAEGALAILLPRTGQGGAKILQDPAETGVGDLQLVLRSVDYDAEGNVTISGEAAPGAKIIVYLDNDAIGQGVVGDSGRWRFTPRRQVPAGLHRLRVDQLSDQGDVVARVETPFSRAAILTDLPQEQFVVVQPGNSLWRIARAVYGEGPQYSVIYRSNQRQIRDPDLIYPGQIFLVPQVN